MKPQQCQMLVRTSSSHHNRHTRFSSIDSSKIRKNSQQAKSSCSDESHPRLRRWQQRHGEWCFANLRPRSPRTPGGLSRQHYIQINRPFIHGEPTTMEVCYRVMTAKLTRRGSFGNHIGLPLPTISGRISSICTVVTQK